MFTHKRDITLKCISRPCIVMLFISKVYLSIFPWKMLRASSDMHGLSQMPSKDVLTDGILYFRYCDQICHPSLILPLLLETASLWGFLFPFASSLICLQTNCLFFILWTSFVPYCVSSLLPHFTTISLITRSLPCCMPSVILYNSSDQLHTNLDTSGKQDSQLRNFLHWIAL